MNGNHQISLFYSYAQIDAMLRDELDKHLSLLRQRGFITQWYDRDISAGTEWAHQIDHHLNTADIILLLISSDFLASTYCYSIEMKRALERHEVGEARVIPVLLRPVDWQDASFAKLQVLPQNGTPITCWRDRDLAFTDIAIQIRRVVKELQESQKSKADKQANGNAQQEHTSPSSSPKLSEFRLSQKKASELGTISNLLHEIEVQLESLSATVQLIIISNEKEKKAPRIWPVLSKMGANQRSSDFAYIQIIWQQTALKIDDLVYFAANGMEALEDERFGFDNGVIRGSPWATELFILQQSLEAAIEDSDIGVAKILSTELLVKCRAHIYRVQKRLLNTIRALDLPIEDIPIEDIPLTTQYHSCFISYSSLDITFATRLHTDLQQRGVQCWFAPHDLRPGNYFRERIDQAIRKQEKLLLILSEHSVASGWVRYEVEMALAREIPEQREILFPLRTDQAIFQSSESWAETLRITRH